MPLTPVRRLTVNAMSVLTSDVADRAATFVVYALVARNLGAFEFGQLALALAFFYPAHVLANAGIKPLLTREVARRRDDTSSFLVNASIVVIAASAVSFLLVIALVSALGYARDTAWVIVVVALGLLPYALSDVTDSIFQAVEKMHLITFVRVPANIGQAAAAFLLLRSGQGMTAIVVLFVALQVSILLAGWVVFISRFGVPSLRPDVTLVKTLARTTVPFLGMTGLIAMTPSAAVIIVSQFTDERQVGLYGAASQILTPLGLMVTSTVLSFFPIMSRRFDRGLAELKNAAMLLFEALFTLALPATIALGYAAEPVLLLLYGDGDFRASAAIVRVLLMSLVVGVGSRALGQALIAANWERISVKIQVINAVLTVAIGVLLTSIYGVMGAAAAVLIVQVVNFAQQYVFAARLLPKFSLTAQMWPKLIAAACMVGVLILLGGQHEILGAIVGLLTYVITLIALELSVAGGPTGLRRKYHHVWAG